MRFTLSTEQRQFAASLTDLLSTLDTPAAVRAWATGDTAPGLRVWRALAEVGVPALAVPERWGGLGASPVDLVVAFERLGHHAVPGPWVDSTAVLPALVAGELAERWLPGVAIGDTRASVVLPPHVPHALDADVAKVRVLVDGTRLRAFSPGAALSSVDPARRLRVAEPGAVLGEVADAERAFALGALATAAQLLGAGQWLLDTSVAYARQRRQYGREIGQFQAVKHLLADVVTRLELARPLVYGAAVALAGPTPDAARDVAAAKVAAGDAAYLAARTGLQVHGAIGYTLEHPLGLWLTKVRALVGAWGTAAVHRRRVLDAAGAGRAG
ncbi:hypothetical protein SAMN05421810_104456 [Amycolatopsis arida]|uniref:Acyl-CoA dehydrogenase n=1 Tax=Amycolatopsis arida TaxID=587909 RepID=A0A1I5VNG5_9PSEU|nr:acyl-CoA dehydrogenase family protein [Amycolatopsis arida]TDX87969.1 hypothetical protein CLV69_112102 [Amycolatopsis arida]SFQ09098.1 hypothetical protein SAMN05421810_104456 [Amycolatopsis arida]